MPTPVGKQLMIDLRGLDRSVCLDTRAWEHAFESVSSLLGARTIATHSHTFDPPADPGLTAYVLLDTSHLSVHTYADSGLAAVDMFVCTDEELEQAANHLLRLLGIDEDAVANHIELKRLTGFDPLSRTGQS